MNPHIVLNFNLSPEAARSGGDGMADAAGDMLPSPLTAQASGAAAIVAGGASTALPSPLDGTGGAGGTASTTSAATQASQSAGGLPTPFDRDGGAAGGTATMAFAAQGSALPTPMQSSHRILGPSQAGAGGGLPTPHEGSGDPGNDQAGGGAQELPRP